MNIEYSPGDWIQIGNSRIDAVVCEVIDNKLEIVYLDDMNRAINEYVIFNDVFWEFENDNPCGGYADKSARLNGYVNILRRSKSV